jgi:putative transposase
VANLALLMGNARSVIKRLRFPLDIMLLCVRWYVAYPLSLRNLEEMMQERGVFVDHSTIHRWVIKLVPLLEEAFRKRKRKRGIRAVGKSWRLDETYIKIRGEDRYWYRAVDKQGNTVDFLLTAKRDRRAARRFFTRAVKNNRLPKIVNIDGSVALRGARVKVGGTVSPLVSDPVGVTPLVGRIVELGTDLSRRRASALCGSCA